MSGRLLRVGMLAGLCLVGGASRAQGGEKASVLPVPEVEQDEAGILDPQATTVESSIHGVDSTSQTIVYHNPAQNHARYLAHHDSSAVTARAIPADALDGFRNNPNYQYDRVETGGPTLGELFWRWLDDVLFRPMRERTSDEFWMWFWIFAGIAALAFAISKALRADSAWFFRKKDNVVEPDVLVLLDTADIESVDLNALLEAALRDRRYRDAARYQYLRALQALTEQGVIEWDKHKTNRDYLAEVRRAGRPGLNGPFADITRLFEWIWYGEFPMDELRFARVRARFELFSEALRGGRR